MAYRTAEGTKHYYSVTFGSAITVSAVTNASPAVATATSHGLVDDQEVLFTSGWEDATDSIYKINQTSANAFEFLGLNATDTNYFAAGTGTGTVKLVSSWVEIPQVLDEDSSGGTPRYITVTPQARRNGFKMPVGFEPVDSSLILGHDPTNATYQAMLAISRGIGTLVAFKSVNGSGVEYGYGYMAVAEKATRKSGQVNQVIVAMSHIGRTISY